jgi:hypothetical protein
VSHPHVCPVCETSCDEATALKVEVRRLRRLVVELMVALYAERELMAFGAGLVEARWPGNRGGEPHG